MSISEAPVLETPVTRRNPLALFVGVLIRPRNTFTYLREQGGWSWVIPIGLALALTLISRVIAAPIERAQAETAMAALQEQLGNSPGGPEGGDSFTFQVGPGGGSLGTAPGNDWLVSYALPLGNVLLNWGVCGLALFGLAWLVGGRPKWGAMFRLSSWALLPSLARVIVTIAVMLIAHRIPITGLQPALDTTAITPAGDTSAPPPGAQVIAIGPGGGPMGAAPNYASLFGSHFLQTVDIYRLWEMVLLVIGVVVMARLDWLRALIPPLGYWGLMVALSTIPLLLMPLLMPLLFGGPVMAP